MIVRISTIGSQYNLVCSINGYFSDCSEDLETVFRVLLTLHIYRYLTPLILAIATF